MTLPDTIRLIQGELGVERDGQFGPVTAANVLHWLQARHLAPAEEKTAPATLAEHFEFDARSETTLATLDPKAQPMFRKFLALAKATAATFGCDYRLISGYRSWAEQDALYAKGRSQPGGRVTNAPGGYSMHNFKTAGDGGVWLGAIYADGGSIGQQALAERVHSSCAIHAAKCGLSWGGQWAALDDAPHWQVDVGHASPTDDDRQKFRMKGSIL